MRAHCSEYPNLLCTVQFESGAIPMSYTKQFIIWFLFNAHINGKVFRLCIVVFFVIYHHICIEQGRAPKETNKALNMKRIHCIIQYTVDRINVCVCVHIAHIKSFQYVNPLCVSGAGKLFLVFSITLDLEYAWCTLHIDAPGTNMSELLEFESFQNGSSMIIHFSSTYSDTHIHTHTWACIYTYTYWHWEPKPVY